MQISYVGENMKIYFCKTIKRNPVHALISGGDGCILKFLGKEMIENILTLQLLHEKFESIGEQ